MINFHRLTTMFQDWIILALPAVLLLFLLHWTGLVRIRLGSGFFFIRTKGSKHHVAKNPAHKKKYGEHEAELGAGGNP